MKEGADGLWGGVAQDGVQHRLAEHANHSLALAAVGRGQNVADLLQLLDHGGLGQTQSGESLRVCARLEDL